MELRAPQPAEAVGAGTQLRGASRASQFFVARCGAVLTTRAGALRVDSMRHWSGYEPEEAVEDEGAGETSKESVGDDSDSRNPADGGVGSTPAPVFRDDLPSVGLVHVFIPNQRALYNGRMRLDSLLSMKSKSITQVRRRAL